MNLQLAILLIASLYLSAAAGMFCHVWYIIVPNTCKLQK